MDLISEKPVYDTKNHPAKLFPYTGITNNLHRRLAEHAAGKGAKYTKGRGPFRLVYRETCQSRAEASRRETAIKSMNRGKASWTVLDRRQGDALLALTKYKKGAETLVERLEAYERYIAHLAAVHATPHQVHAGDRPDFPAPL